MIVPVHDGASFLPSCLGALTAAARPDTEIIVVDDASHDDSAAIAARYRVRVIRLEHNVGAAGARNRGARAAAGDVLVFIDADVEVAPDTIERLVGVLDRRPDVAAVFGSYDAVPRAPGLVSQYRNLLHHFVHQHGDAEASTFWTGCGAIRRAVFEASQGFDEGRHARSIEDIELGYRIRAAGHRIVLDPTIQATHLKHWTLWSVLRTDAMLRALPWARLVIERRPPNDLNIRLGQRVSVGLTMIATALLPLALVRPASIVLPVAAYVAVAIVNYEFLAFLARVRGPAFAVATVPLLLLHYLESGLCYAWAWLAHAVSRGRPGANLPGPAA